MTDWIDLVFQALFLGMGLGFFFTFAGICIIDLLKDAFKKDD